MDRRPMVPRAGTGALALVCALALLALPAVASVALPPGARVRLLGTTAAAEPDLAGVVLHDRLIPFVIRNAAGAPVFAGRLQDRVVRSSATGHLHFYYRIRDTQPNLPGHLVVAGVQPTAWGSLAVDWRQDGLGAAAPVEARRAAGAADKISFHFAAPVIPGPIESRFFFIKTDATAFAPGGTTVVLLVSTGETVLLDTTHPRF